MWRKGNPPTLLVGMYTGVATMQNSGESQGWGHTESDTTEVT